MTPRTPPTKRRGAVRVVLQGGLGNQLFQFFLGLLEAHHQCFRELRLFATLLGRYSSPRTLEIANLIDIGPGSLPVHVCPIDPLSSLRIPKVASKFIAADVRLRIPGFGTLLDGYYQEPRYFMEFDAALVADTLSQWRARLKHQGLLVERDMDAVVHLRLRDFFGTQEATTHFVRDSLSSLGHKADIVTDDEDIVADVLRHAGSPASLQLAPTREMTAWDVLRILTHYSRIRTNGSSLAFWAAVLGRIEFESSNSAHVELWRYLLRQP